MPRCSRDDVVYTWEIKNFEHILDYCVVSPEVQLSALNNGFWQVVVYPLEKHAGKDYIHCGLRKTPVHTDPHETTVLFSFELQFDDGKVSAKFGPKCGEFPRDNHLAHPVGLHGDFYGTSRQCGVLTVKCRVRRLRDPSHCIAATLSAVTDVMTQRVTKFIEVDSTAEEIEREIVIAKPVCSESRENPREGECKPLMWITIGWADDERYEVTLTSVSDAPPFVVTCVMSLMETTGRLFTSTARKTFYFPVADLALEFPHLISKTLLEDETRNLMNEKLKFLLRFDMEFSVGDINHRQDKRPFTRQHIPGCKSTLCDDLERAFLAQNHDWAVSIDQGYPTTSKQKALSSIPVHKAMLASRSPVFQAMLERNMREKSSKVVSLPDMDATTMHKMIRFIYSDYVTFVDDEGNDMDDQAVIEIYKVANMYLLKTLREDCSAHLQWRLNDDNAEFLKEFARLYEDDQLAEAVTEFLNKDAGSAAKAND